MNTIDKLRNTGRRNADGRDSNGHSMNLPGVEQDLSQSILSEYDPSDESLVNLVNEDMDGFMAQYSDLIESAVSALTRFRDSSAGQDAIKVYQEAIQSETEPSLQLGEHTANLFREDIELGGVFNKAYKQGMRGLGLGVDADGYAFAWGGRAGAEGLIQFPYRVGTYTTSTQVKGRYWYTRSKGTGLGFSLSLGLTFFLVPPLNTDRFFGAYFGYLPIVPYPIPVQRVAGFGGQVELFSWLPKTDSANLPSTNLQRSGFHPITKIWKAIFGFRVAVDAGVDLPHALALTKLPYTGWTKWTPLIGTFQKGTQRVSNAALELPTYTLAPTAIQKQEGGVDVIGNLTPPMRAGGPNRVFRTAGDDRDATTLTIRFPSWLSDYFNSIATSDTQLLTISGTGTAETQSYDSNNHYLPTKPWKIDTSALSDQKISLTWVGTTDQEAWAEDFTFTLAGVTGNSSESLPSYGGSVLTLKGVDSLYSLISVPYSFNAIQMGLVETLFKASLTTKLQIDKTYLDQFKLAWIPWSDSATTDKSQWVYVDESEGKYVNNGDTWEYDVSLTTDNSQSPQTDTTCRLVYSDDYKDDDGNPLALALIPPQDDVVMAYYCGYVFQQQGAGQQACQILAVLWKMGTPFRSRNYYGTDNETLKYNESVTSTAKYDGDFYGSSVVWEIDATQTYPAS